MLGEIALRIVYPLALRSRSGDGAIECVIEGASLGLAHECSKMPYPLIGLL